MSIPNIPEGRTENYLGNLIGQETAWEPGNPESRVEEYLDYILNNGTKLEQEMEDEIESLKAIGRFLSLWNATTGKPTTDPSKLPYKYKTGDYYIVSVVGITNYQPSGNKYDGIASTTLYSGDLAVNDFFVYDGLTWTHISHAEVATGSAYEAFPDTWPTTSSYTTAQFCVAVNSDANAVQGKAYLGEVTWSDLPASMANAEVQVEIMSGSGTSNKTMRLICTSGNQPPYRWEYTYWNNGSNVSGWIGFQPEPFEIPITMGQGGSWSTSLTFNQIRSAIQNYGTNMVISMDGAPVSVNSVGYDDSEGEGYAIAMMVNGDGPDLIGLVALLENNSVSIDVVSVPLGDNVYFIPITEVSDDEFTTSATPTEIREAIEDGKRIVVTLENSYMPANVAANDSGFILVECHLYDPDSGVIIYVTISGASDEPSCVVSLHEYSSGMSNPMTTTGDIIVGGQSGAPERLAKGTDGQVLKIVSGSPAWSTDNTGMSNPMTTAGDLIVGGTSGTPTRLAKGSDGQVLKMISGSVAWASDSAGMSNPMTTAGDIIVGGSSGTPGRLAKGANGTLLGVNSSGNLAYTAGLPYTTTAPTAANTDGIKIAVLSSDPATKYNGWLYIITGA